MSVDVEDYFHVSAFERVVSRERWPSFSSRVDRNTRTLLDIFDIAGVRATFFALGWIAARNAPLLREIASRGHELASHGYHHQLLYALTREQFRQDVRAAKNEIEDAAGVPVIGFRAPSYSMTAASLWALDVLIEEGYLYDTSIYPIHHDRYGIPDAPRHVHRIERAAGALIEVPAATVRVGGINLPIGGGGYFRLLPYAWTQWGIARVNRVESQPIIFYVHPWEIDPEQPRIKVRPTVHLRHYSRLRSTGARLKRLLRQFRFDSVRSILQLTSPAASAPRFDRVV